MKKTKEPISNLNKFPKMIPVPMTLEMFEQLKNLSTAENISCAQTIKRIMEYAFGIKNGAPTLQDILDVLKINLPTGRPLRVSFLKR